MMKESHQYDTLIPFLVKIASKKQKGITFIHGSEDEEFMSYSQLYHESRCCLFNIQNAGLIMGDELLFQVEDNKQSIILFWACLLGGIIPVPLTVGDREDYQLKVLNVWRKLSHPYVVADDLYFDSFVKFLSSNNLEGEKDSFANKHLAINKVFGGSDYGKHEKINALDLAYIQFSSGSTGQPKGVMLTHDNLVTNTLDIIKRSATENSDRILSWMPLTHDMGMICFHLCGVVAGTDQYLMPTQLFVRKPVLWIEKCHEHKISQLYSPNFGFHYFLSAYKQIETPSWDLSRIRIIYNGAEPISYEICHEFLNILSLFGLKPSTMYPGYGLAEASVAVALPEIGDTFKQYNLLRSNLNIGETIVEQQGGDGVVFVETGMALENCKIRICGSDDEIYKEGVIGEIQIKGRNVTSGYYNDFDATQNILTKDGWLQTGDLGFLKNNRLVITGRAKNIIIINGQNYYPQDIEKLVQDNYEQFNYGKVVACGLRNNQIDGEHLLIFLQFKGETGTLQQMIPEIKALILNKMGIIADQVIPIKRIPRTTSGKVRNFMLVEKYRKGEFNEILKSLNQQSIDYEIVSQQEKSSTLQRLKTIWANTFPGTNVLESQNYFEIGINSLMALKFIQNLQSDLQIRITFKDVFNHPTLEQLSNYIEKNQRRQIISPIPKIAVKSFYPLSDLQKKFWFLHYYDESQTALNLQAMFHFEGEIIDVEAFEKSFQKIVDDHEIFRSIFVEQNGVPVQKIVGDDEATFSIDFKDLCNKTNINEEVTTFTKQYVEMAFDPSSWPLFKIALLKTNTSCYTFIFVIHHIITDGTSVGLLVDELRSHYYNLLNGQNPISTAAVQFKDFVKWQAGLTELSHHDTYWRHKFSRQQSIIDLPFAKPRKTTQSFQGELVEVELSTELSEDIIQFSNQNEVTIFTIICAVTRVLLNKYTDQFDLVLGTDADARLHPDLINCMGPFLNTIPLSLAINDKDDFKQIVTKEKSNMLDAFDHQPYSFGELVQKIDQNKLSRNPLFDVLVLFQNMDRSFDFGRILRQANVKKVKLDFTSILTDLEFEYFLVDHQLKANVKFNRDLFLRKDIERLCIHKQNLLQALLKQPTTPVRDISMLNHDEMVLLNSFEKGPAIQPKPRDVFAAIERQFSLNSNAVALRFEGKEYTYRQLMLAVNKTALILVSEYKLKEQDLVGLLVQRDEKMIILLLALLKINVIYLPIDPDNPQPRISLILKDSQVKNLITDSSVTEASDQLHNDIIWVDDLFLPHNTNVDYDSVETPVTSSKDIAYILYTSGTSGAPKGVMVGRESVSDYINTFKAHFNISLKDKVIQQSSLSFDISVEEIFPILASGGMLIVLNEGGKNIDDLLHNIVNHQATILSTTPLVIKELNQKPQLLKSIRALISGGESLKGSYIDNLIGKISLYNSYGPTEATVCVTYHQIDNIEHLNVIGRPLPNHQVKILDKNLLPVGIGVEGEIYVSGIGVATGYLNRPEDTNARFITDHRIGELKTYKTGDLGRWSTEGTIIFSGRNDNQIKWRGYRIEPAEIERSMLAHCDISHAFVCLKKNKSQTSLIGYFIAENTLNKNELLNTLSRKLPSYMVPGKLIQLHEFPVNTNGKIDSEALPYVDKTDSNVPGSKHLPINDTEKLILSIWQEVFSTIEINVNDNFFAIGGQSLNAAKIAARIHSKLGIKPSFKQIFTNPTIRQLADSIRQKASEAKLLPLNVAEKRANYELSFGQKRLWMLHQLLENKAAYNLTWTFELASTDMVPFFEVAIEILVARHESLRTVFPVVKDKPIQKILSANPAVQNINKLKINDDGAHSAMSAIISNCANQYLDIENGPLLCVTLVELESKNVAVIITMHHIISDGWSMEIFQSELRHIIDRLKANKQPVLNKLPVQYKDFASWQLQNANRPEMQVHKTYWTQQFLDEIPSLKPKYVDKKAVYPAQQGNTIRFSLSPDLISRLTGLANKFDASLFMIIHSVLNLLLFKVSGLCDITVCAPVASRNHKYLEPLIGYFLNLLPLRLKFDPEQTFEALIHQTKVVVTEAYDHQDYPVDWLFEELQKRSRSNAERLFDILIVMQNFNGGDKNKLQLEDREPLNNLREVDNDTSISDLLFEINQFSGDWELKIRYNTVLYDEKQIVALANRFEFLSYQILTNAHLQIHLYDIVLPEEKWLLSQYNYGPGVRHAEQNIIALFDIQVIKTPENIALVNNGNGYTYHQLNCLVNKFANYILDQSNVNPADRIALDCNREEYMVVALLAILKVGACYVPIDPAYPQERKSFIIEDCQVRMVISDGDRSFPLPSNVYSIDIKQEASQIAQYSSSLVMSANVNPDHEAYVMYTSGSTGRPKGVSITHRALADYVQTFIQYFQLTPKDRVIQQSSLAFDVSVEEIFPTLCCGASLLLNPQGGRNIEGLINLINEENATILSTTPLVINELNQADQELKSLRLLISGGDTLKSSYIDQIFEKVNVFNTYGPTECTVCATYHEVKSLENVEHIGRPIANHAVYLLDPYLIPVPPGVAGEVYIGGNGLSSGYIGMKSETNKRFIQIPHISNGKLYKTGDQAMWKNDGSLKFLGRNDDQIKINGYRVEPGEIERIISSNPSVGNTLVLPVHGTTDNILIAYYSGDKSLDSLELKNWTKQIAPAHMIPAVFCHLDSFPLTINGKVNKDKLPSFASLMKNQQDKNQKPKDAVEGKLAIIWEQILNLKVKSVEDDFFSLGGNSIKATKLIGKIKAEFGVILSLAEVFKSATIREQKFLVTHTKKAFDNHPVPLPQAATYNVSNAQKRLWILHQFEEERAAYNILLPFYINGKLDVERLEKCLGYLVRRHESLRTVFCMVDGDLQQMVSDPDQFQFSLLITDLSNRKLKDQIVRDTIKKEQLRHFDLTTGPLFFCQLIKLDATKYMLLINQHHIISDGWSVNVLMSELSTLYHGNDDADIGLLEHLNFQYKDFTAYLNRLIASKEIQPAREYWLNQFQSEIPKINLPCDFNRPPTRSAKGHSIDLIVDKSLYLNLQKACREEDISFFVLMLASYNILLSKYCQQNKFVVGSPVSGREQEYLENQIGCYVNTLALKSKIDGDQNISAYLRETKYNVLQGLHHQVYPFDLLVEGLPLEKDLSRSPLFDVMLVLHQNPVILTNEINKGITVEPCIVANQTCKYDLILNVFENQNEVRLVLEYNADLFKEQTATMMLKNFISILNIVQKDSGLRINEIDFLSKGEKDQLINQFNNTGGSELKCLPVTSMFENNAVNMPHATALYIDEKKYSFRQINNIANQIARMLLDQFDIGAGDLVGLLTQRTELMVASIIAIMKSQATYIPIDPVYPDERINYMLNDSDVSLVITEEVFKEKITSNKKTLLLNELSFSAPKDFDSNKLPRPDKNQLSHIIYTSGSTGLPKGVAITHRSLSALINWSIAEFQDDDVELVYALTSCCFDLSLFEIFYPLCSGKSIRIMDSALDVDKFLTKDNNVLINTVPSVVTNLLENGVNLNNLRSLNMAGEIIPVSIKDELKGTSIKVRNLYGPSEDTTYSTCYLFSEVDNNIPIGKPISGTNIYILDNQEQLTPMGVTGQIAIAGKGLASGYLNRPALTNRKFIPNLFKPGETMYLTGDFGKWQPDGNLQFQGRVDDQVKIRGYRIELGEIENSLYGIHEIEKVVVKVCEISGEDQIVAFFIATDNINVDQIKSTLWLSLPTYMIPQIIIELPEFPLTPNGKIDKKQLNVNSGELLNPVAPITSSNPIVKKLRPIWQNYVGINFGLDDSFFDVGGHSLKATQLVNRINKVFNTNIGLKEVFTNAKFQQQIRLIEESKTSFGNQIDHIEEQYFYRTSNAQSRLWILSKLEPNNPAYNMSSLYKIEGNLDFKALSNAYRLLINKYEILRTYFLKINQEPKQVILPHGKQFMINFHDLQNKNIDTFSHACQLAGALAVKPFTLEKWPLIRLDLYKLKEQEFIFSLVMHHIISDAWSMEIMFKEIIASYKYFIGVSQEEPQPLKFQYKNFSTWQRRLMSRRSFDQSKAYWTKQMKKPLPVLDIRPDRPRPSIKSHVGDRVTKKIELLTVNQIKKLVTSNDASTFMVLLTVFKILLNKYSGQQDIIVGTPIAGRQNLDFEDQIGFYVNVIAVRTIISSEDNFSNLLLRIKSTIVNGFEYQDYPLHELVELLELPRDLSRSPLFDVMVNHIDQSFAETNEASVQNVNFNELTLEKVISKYDLNITFLEKPETVDIILEYNADLFDKHRIERMMAHFEVIMQSVIKNPNQLIADINYLTKEEKNNLADTFSDSLNITGDELNIIQQIEHQVVETPDRIAIICQNENISFENLNQLVNKVAWHLIRNIDLKQNPLVGILMERSAYGIITILGILKAGGAYLPIDPGQPLARINQIIADSNSKIVIADKSSIKKVKIIGATPITDILKKESKYTNPLISINKDQLCYAIYTSGTTGRPKGVLVENNSLNNLCQWLSDLMYARDKTPLKVLLNAPITFDSSVKQIFPPLINGSTLTIIPENIQKDPKALTNLMVKLNINVFDATPSHLSYLLRFFKKDKYQIKYTLLGGEPVTTSIIERYYKVFQQESYLINVYGITETTVDSTFNIVDNNNQRDISVGKPIPNTQIYILDKDQNPVPHGTEGELYIGGKGLSRGYLNQPALTHENFIYHKEFNKKLYRSGDTGYWLNTGKIALVGRKDRQIKLRGFRIELKEIEKILEGFEFVEQAIVIKTNDHVGDEILVGYIQSKATQMDQSFIRSKLALILPVYMVPAYIVIVDKFVLTNHGKIDIHELPAFDISSIIYRKSFELPQNETQEILLKFWKNVLGIENVSVSDNFFEIGGNSLKVVNLYEEIQKTYPVTIEINEIFSNPTINELAALIDKNQDVHQSDPLEIDNINIIDF